jgi:DNA-directed RNA polymerase specialized sigma24 family protein
MGLREVAGTGRATDRAMDWNPYLKSRPWLRAYAIRLAAASRPELDRKDAAALADLGLVLAARRYDPARGYAFSTYARRWVAGEVLRAGKEARRWARHAVPEEEAHASAPATAEASAILRDVLGGASEEELHVLWVHGVQGHSLAEASRRVGHHRAWGHRVWQGLRRRLADAA